MDFNKIKYVLFCICLPLFINACTTNKVVSYLNDFENTNWEELSSLDRFIKLRTGLFKVCYDHGCIPKGMSDSIYVAFCVLGDPNKTNVHYLYEEVAFSQSVDKPFEATIYKVEKTAPDSIQMSMEWKIFGPTVYDESQNPYFGAFYKSEVRGNADPAFFLTDNRMDLYQVGTYIFKPKALDNWAGQCSFSFMTAGSRKNPKWKETFYDCTPQGIARTDKRYELKEEKVFSEGAVKDPETGVFYQKGAFLSNSSLYFKRIAPDYYNLPDISSKLK